MGELEADFRQRRREREVHQAEGTVGGDHDVGRRDVAVDHLPAVHARHRAGQRHCQPDEVVGGQRFGQSRQARVAGVRQHDRPRVPQALRQLGDPRDTTQPGQHGHLMPQPAYRIRPQRLLTDDCATSKKHPGNPRASAPVHDLGTDGLSWAQQRSSSPHPAPPRATAPLPYLAGARSMAQGSWPKRPGASQPVSRTRRMATADSSALARKPAVGLSAIRSA